MARKTEKPETEAEERPETGRQKKLLTRGRECYKRLVENPVEQQNRREALEDMKFLHVPGEQWDASQKKRRGKRPCYEFNLTSVRAMRVINDMRANRAQGKVRGTEDGDKDTAETLEGLIRNISTVSNFDQVQDYAAGYQVGGGMGAWRVETKYSDDSTFDQDIAISAIKNPFGLYVSEDRTEAILLDKIPNAEYERRWPKAKRIDFEASEFDGDDDWADENETRICEYWYREPVMRELALLADGRTVTADQVPEGVEVKQKRKVQSWKVRNCVMSGSAVLEEGEFAGKFIPFVQAFGQKLVVDGKTIWYGITRNVKDAARGYNVMYTAAVEAVANAPKAPYWATPEQANGHLDKWSVANDENLPVMLYNPDPKADGPPQRMGGADVPMAYIQMLTVAEQALNASMGIHENSLGQEGAEKSGRAIMARQQQGELATFNFKANMAEAVRQTWEILVDLVPKVYTNERSIRVLGVDGAEKYVKVNSVQLDAASLSAKPVNDLTRGKYDVAITVGPSFSTKRQEAAEFFAQMSAQDPGLMATAADIVYKAADVPYADQIAERRQAMLPPQIQAQIAQGKPMPPEVQAAMAQVEQATQQVQQQAQLIQQAMQEAETSKAESEKAKAQVDTAIANLQTERAQFDAYVAQQTAKLQQSAFKQATAEVQGQRDQIYQEIAQAAQQFLQQAGEALQQVQGEQGRLSQSVDQAISALFPREQPQVQ